MKIWAMDCKRTKNMKKGFQQNIALKNSLIGSEEPTKMYVRCGSSRGINNNFNVFVIQCYSIKDGLSDAVRSLNT